MQYESTHHIRRQTLDQLLANLCQLESAVDLRPVSGVSRSRVPFRKKSQLCEAQPQVLGFAPTPFLVGRR